MAQQTQVKDPPASAAQTRMTEAPPSAGKEVAIANPRLAYPVGVDEKFNIDRTDWRALVDAVWPLAKSTEAVVLALTYCKKRGLDPFKRVVHIVPMWNAALGREVETVWPGIAEHRTTAARTGGYAGMDPAAFGPTIDRVFSGTNRSNRSYNQRLEFPEWAQVTVYRIVQSQRVAFPGPRCYFVEWFGYRKGAAVPNERWTRAPFQMLEKCAEAAALRRAFPEEIGDEATADEMEGRIIDEHGVDVAIPVEAQEQRPHRDRHESPAEREYREAVERGEVTDVEDEGDGESQGDKGAKGNDAKGDQGEAESAEEKIPHAEVVPRKRGNTDAYFWPEWQKEILERVAWAEKRPNGLAFIEKLRRDNAKWMALSSIKNLDHQALVAKMQEVVDRLSEGGQE